PFELPAHTCTPVAKPVPAHDIPVVQRITPELARLREVIGWDARHHSWPPTGIELKLSAIRPRLRRVGSDIERQIAEQPDATGVRVRPQALPLRLESELLHTEAVHLGSKLGFGARHRRWLAVPNVGRPCPPGCALVSCAQRFEANVVLEPVARAFQERLVLSGFLRRKLLWIEQAD